MIVSERLAIDGGRAVASRPWPVWPTVGPWGRELLAAVADSGVWTISGRSRGAPLQCQLFRDEFASFMGRAWCVETDHGTGALVSAFDALGLGPGDEVIVPALTWVACATSVLEVGATPVLVDVDPATLCMSPAAAAAALTPRTRCILAVHLHCTAADVAELAALAARHGLALVEDCAQAHGARWRDGRPLGSHGVLATFSMQQSKAMTSGEGGALVGDDPDLRRRVECARADGRVLPPSVPPAGEMFLVETGELTGANHCLSEFGAALLRDGLRRLPNEVERRARNASALDAMLPEVGVRTIAVHPQLHTRPVYEYGIFLDPEVFGPAPADRLRAALSAELGLPVYATDAPLHVSPLFRPETNRRLDRARRPRAGAFPVAEAAFERLAMIHHAAFLAEPERMEEIAAACRKLIEAGATGGSPR
jgi:L-glutamine:2-deoxy-scyllo-inosose/3-amino-2,3-dideoxy-scyllo-inosose aminotransferase